MAKQTDQSAAVLSTLDDLSNKIISAVGTAPSAERKIIAIAGPPASGKSTLMTELVHRLQMAWKPEQVTGIPMDGYHLDNLQLDCAGLRSVKGAPQTFDVRGLLSLLSRLHAGEHPVFAPTFDRAGDLSRNCAIKIDQMHELVLIEGNYLLLDQPVWREFVQYFALTVAIDVPIDVLHERLINRWLHYGLSEKEASEKALGNDIPNASTVVEQSITADIIYRPENNK